MIARVLLVLGSATAAAAKTARRILEGFMEAFCDYTDRYGLRYGSYLSHRWAKTLVRNQALIISPWNDGPNTIRVT